VYESVLGLIHVRPYEQSMALIEKPDVLASWTDRFNLLMNRQSSVFNDTSTTAGERISKQTPSSAEIAKTRKQTSSGNAEGSHEILADIYKMAIGEADCLVPNHLAQG